MVVEVDKKIVQSFFQWKKVEFSDGLVASLEWQMSMFKATVGSDIVKQFPVEREYCLRFCKNLTQSCQEVSEEWYEAIGELVSRVHYTT